MGTSGRRRRRRRTRGSESEREREREIMESSDFIVEKCLRRSLTRSLASGNTINVFTSRATKTTRAVESEREGEKIAGARARSHEAERERERAIASSRSVSSLSQSQGRTCALSHTYTRKGRAKVLLRSRSRVYRALHRGVNLDTTTGKIYTFYIGTKNFVLDVRYIYLYYL